MEIAWFTALISAICFEGLGRRYLPGVPDATFYFLKDIVLLWGFIRFRPSPTAWRALRYLYRGFQLFFIAALFWTVIEVLNPDQLSKPLALVGLRSYWLWWLATPVVATVLQNPKVRERAIYALLAVSVVVAAFAAVQFASPADSSINLYEGHGAAYEMGPVKVGQTDRARVSSTFTFVSGFVAFTLEVPALLLSFGLDAKNPRLRAFALAGTMITAAVIPMGGSRSSIVVGLAILALSLWSAGIFTRVGRRILIGAVAAAVVSVVAVPDAMEGVQSRFADVSETSGRFQSFVEYLPPVALATFQYPVLGIGTGMMQNARFSFNAASPEWDAESELARYLIELGPVGFILFWLAKLGLMVALLRAYKLLKRAGHRGGAAAALSYAAITLTGNLTFDHNWQALYFLGCGFVLSDVLAAAREHAANESPRGDEPEQVGAPPVRALAFSAEPPR
jgi:hypothetical protein